MMKTLCLMDSVSRANGGIFEAERRLQQSLHSIAGVAVQVIGLRDSQTEADRIKWSPLNPLAHGVRGPQAFGYAPGLFTTLLRADADLAYCVGLWKYPSLAALRWSRQTGKPMLVAPHGMLDPWALKNSRWKKAIASRLFQKAQLQQAACVRALCEAEACSIRAYGLKNPIAIIPNGIDLPMLAGGSQVKAGGSCFDHFAAGRKVLLYLGRIHPKKGLVNLLRAWAQTLQHQPHWMLAIAGWDQGGHEAELKALASELGIPWADIRTPVAVNNQKSSPLAPPASLLFMGPQFNDAKDACYANCDGFVLPSFSEGLPMVVLEAWSHGKPVLMTPECNLPEGFAANAAIRIETGVEPIAQGLAELFRSSPAGLRSLGDNGRALVAARFTWPKVATEMKAVYAWLVGGGPPPSCVLLK